MACSPDVSTAVPCALLVLADIPAAPVLGVMTFALVITLMGHINKNAKTVGVGIAILFLATGAMIFGAYLSYTGGDGSDPRPCNAEIPGTC
ncbi:MAG: hypothetical protein JWN65_1995 [Solirubrobacterales bacterium]|nr:hypothetical protein [Solirubrobacterales bacterium]